MNQYLRGDTLKDTRRLDNKRRVIVKRCPPNSTEAELESLFSYYGEVTLAYFFRQDLPTKGRGSVSKNGSATYKTASILFSDSRSAEELLHSS